MDSIWSCYAEYWKKYAEFSGRTSKKAFWSVFLCQIIIGLLIGVFQVIPFTAVAFYYLESIYNIVTIVPSLAIESRRLIDAGRSPYNLFFWLLPIVGWIILLVYFLEPSKVDLNGTTRADVGL